MTSGKPYESSICGAGQQKIQPPKTDRKPAIFGRTSGAQKTLLF
jgi:hypothetical protein